jgi:hypothetical protein
MPLPVTSLHWSPCPTRDSQDRWLSTPV